MDQQDFRQQSQELQRLAMETEVTVSSPDHAVRIVAGSGGHIKDLELTHRAFNLSGEELGRTIVATLNDARTQVDAQLSAAMSAILGEALPPNLFGGGLEDIDADDQDDDQTEERR